MSNVLLKPTAVAARLRLGPQRVRQLDGDLRPLRTEDGIRLYLLDEVEAYAARRDHKKASR